MNIGIVGSRRRTRHADYVALMEQFDYVLHKIREDLPDEPINLISGGCPSGADSWVYDIAEYYELEEPIVHPADWDKHGRAAGILRNTLIAQDSEILIAVVAEDRTGGTEDTIKKFKAMKPDNQLIII